MPVERFEASGVVGTAGKPTRIISVQLRSGAGAGSTADIADQETAGGDSLVPLVAAAAGAADRVFGGRGLPLTTAGYLTLSGADAFAIVEHHVSTPDF